MKSLILSSEPPKNRTAAFVGIDPATRQHGFAVCLQDIDSKVYRFVRFMYAHQFFAWWAQINDAYDVLLLAFEDSRKIRADFNRKGYAGNAAISRTIGQNQGICGLIADAAKDAFKKQHKAKLWAVSPDKKGEVIYNVSVVEALIASEGYAMQHEKKIVKDDLVAFHLCRMAANRHHILKLKR